MEYAYDILRKCLVLLCLCGVFSCVNDEELAGTNKGDVSYVNLVFNTRGSLPSPVENCETGISSLRVFIFNIAGQLEFTDVYTASSDGNIENPVIKVTPGVKDIYAVANEAMEGISVMDFSTLSAKEDLENWLVSYVTFPSTSLRGLLMAGKILSQTVLEGKTHANPQKIVVELTRNCARLDLKMTNASTSGILLKKIELLNGCTKQFLLQDASIDLPVGSEYDLSKLAFEGNEPITSVARVDSFYMPENLVGQTDVANSTKMKINYSVNGVAKEETITLKAVNTDTKIIRNTKYTLNLSFTPELTLNLFIEDWDDITVEGDVLGEELSVSQSKILMDWWNFNESFSTTFNIYASDNISFIGYEHNGTTTTDGSNLPAWLPLKNIIGIPAFVGTARNAIITLTYVLDNTPIKYPVYLWFKAGNIRKRVEIVYDNGYLTHDLLYKNGWTQNTPSEGIHIAKIGNRHPLLTAASVESKIEWSATSSSVRAVKAGTPLNPQKHGWGPTNTTYLVDLLEFNASAAWACRALGKKWYLPSYDEINTVSALRNYFGESYKINVTDKYWTSNETASATTAAIGIQFDTQCSLPKTEAFSVRAIYSNDMLTIDPTTIVADYAAWDYSFSKSIAFESQGGAVTITSVDNVGSSKNWLTSATLMGTTSGTLNLTYAPTEGNAGVHDDVSVVLTDQDGNNKLIIVKYDNGFIDNSYLRKYGWTSNLPKEGVQLSKRGAILPSGVALDTEAKVEKSYTSNVSIPSLVEPTIYAITTNMASGIDIDRFLGWTNPVPTYGNGYSNTQTLKGYSQCAMIPYCMALGNAWYIASVGETCILVKNDILLGPSYSFKIQSGYFLTSSFSGGMYTDYIGARNNRIYDAYNIGGWVRPIINY